MPPYRTGDCVRIPDGRPGRVRGKDGTKVKVRVRRRATAVDEILLFSARELERIEPPPGWMSPAGYNRRVAAIRRRSRARQP